MHNGLLCVCVIWVISPSDTDSSPCQKGTGTGASNTVNEGQMSFRCFLSACMLAIANVISYTHTLSVCDMSGPSATNEASAQQTVIRAYLGSSFKQVLLLLQM